MSQSSLHDIRSIRDAEELDELMTRPPGYLVEAMRWLSGDVLVLGVGGKMGPSVARMARRAMDEAGAKGEVIGVARFSSPGLAEQLNGWGVRTVAADLMDEGQLARLPEAQNVVFMAGMKFGSTGQEAMTWAMNCYLPGRVCQRYRSGRIVVFSTGNIYGLVPVPAVTPANDGIRNPNDESMTNVQMTNGGRMLSPLDHSSLDQPPHSCPPPRSTEAKGDWGSKEADFPNPLGDYAMSCLGRERMVEHFSRTLNIRAALIRLNYATEMRYGVLVDLARRVWAGETVDLAMGHVNVIWQGDACAMALAALGHVASPPFVLNVAGPELLSVRAVCEEYGKRMGREPRFVGSESGSALLNDGSKGHKLFGLPRVPAEQLIRWTAEWVMRGGASLDKPTHFEARDGKF